MRLNQHQVHFEDLVLEGTNGLKELNHKIDNFILRLKQKPNDQVITSKLDGCLHPDTLVLTTEGDVPISTIINNYPKHIYNGYGMDSEGNVIIVELKFPRVISGNKNWVSLILENNSVVVATEDHQFKVASSYKDASDLLNEDIEEL